MIDDWSNGTFRTSIPLALNRAARLKLIYIDTIDDWRNGTFKSSLSLAAKRVIKIVSGQDPDLKEHRTLGGCISWPFS